MTASSDKVGPWASPRWLSSVPVFIVVASLIGGTWFYHDQERGLRQQAEGELTAIARLKADEVSKWREDRILDGDRMSLSPSISLFVNRWLQDPTPEYQEELRRLLDSLRFGGRYRDVLLVSKDGRVLLNSHGEPAVLHPSMLDELKVAVESRATSLTELYSLSDEAGARIDVITPLYRDTPESDVVAAIVLHASAEDFLYPLIESWPLQSQTAETLLVSLDGDDVLYLSNTMDAADAALSLRVPLGRNEVSVARAALGEEGIVDAVDHRGEPVLAYLTSIPGSNWLMVAEVDASEAFSAWRARAKLITGLVLALMVLAIGWYVVVVQRVRTSRLAELLAAERARLEAEERLGVILASVGDAVISTDAECRVEFMNPAAEKLTGWIVTEAKGMPVDAVFSIIDEDTRLPVENPAECVAREGASVAPANRVLVSRDGHERAIADSAAPIRDESGDLSGLVLVFRDQTEERAARRALVASEERFRTLVEGAPDAIFVNADNQFAYVNEAMCDLVGAGSFEELIGMPVFRRVHPDYHELGEQRVRDLIRGRVRQSARETVFLRLDGTPVDVETSGMPILYEGREAALVFVRDITARKQAQRALQESEELLRIARDLARLGGWSVDLGTDRVQWSEEVAAIHEQPVGFSPGIDEALDYYAPESRARIREVFEECASRGTPYDEELQIISGTGRRVWVRTIGVPVRDEAGAITGVRGAFQDISDRKASEQELERHRDHLEELVAERTRELEEMNAILEDATRAKSRFLANMSHELRTPLNSIIGFSSVLVQGLAGPLSEEQRSQIGMVNASGRHLLSVIDDILDLAKVEAGRVEVRHESVDLAPIVSEVAQILRPLAAEKGLSMEIEVPEKFEPIASDAGKVKQVLLNLTGNAVKFTDSGVVRIHASQSPGGDVTICVSDTGPGIGSDELPRIFDAFTQFERPGNAKPKGTGLGLAISQEYARLLGGRIIVRSKTGEGSEFTLVVPPSK